MQGAPALQRTCMVVCRGVAATTTSLVAASAIALGAISHGIQGQQQGASRWIHQNPMWRHARPLQASRKSWGQKCSLRGRGVPPRIRQGRLLERGGHILRPGNLKRVQVGSMKRGREAWKMGRGPPWEAAPTISTHACCSRDPGPVYLSLKRPVAHAAQAHRRRQSAKRCMIAVVRGSSGAR